jgi:plasmid stabilization system protein ParE
VDWEVAWTESALAGVETAVRLAARHSDSAAESLRAALFESVEVLARFPRIGPIYEADESGRTREIMCRQYRIFYRLREAEQRVEVLLVWHSARREPRLPY